MATVAPQRERFTRRRASVARPAVAGAWVLRLVGPDGLLLFALVPLVTAGFVRLLSGPVIDPDYWWHLATGRWMLEHGRIPFHDPFSYTHAGQTWYAHEWLAELGFAVADRVAGYAANL